jgi:hypothetical protein
MKGKKTMKDEMERLKADFWRSSKIENLEPVASIVNWNVKVVNRYSLTKHLRALTTVLKKTIVL